MLHRQVSCLLCTLRPVESITPRCWDSHFPPSAQKKLHLQKLALALALEASSQTLPRSFNAEPQERYSFLLHKMNDEEKDDEGLFFTASLILYFPHSRSFHCHSLILSLVSCLYFSFPLLSISPISEPLCLVLTCFSSLSSPISHAHFFLFFPYRFSFSTCLSFKLSLTCFIIYAHILPLVFYSTLSLRLFLSSPLICLFLSFFSWQSLSIFLFIPLYLSICYFRTLLLNLSLSLFLHPVDHFLSLSFSLVLCLTLPCFCCLILSFSFSSSHFPASLIKSVYVCHCLSVSPSLFL